MCTLLSYVAAFEKIYIFFKDLWDTSFGWRKRKLQCGNVPSLFEVNLNRGFSSHYYLEDWMHARKFFRYKLVDTNMSLFNQNKMKKKSWKFKFRILYNNDQCCVVVCLFFFLLLRYVSIIYLTQNFIQLHIFVIS